MDKWSETKLIAAIETFGFQMAEMGRQDAHAANAAMQSDYDGVRMYTGRVEMYRSAAYDLKREIAEQIILRDAEISKV